MSLHTSDLIASKILILRSQRVMIDADLAELYGVPTKALNQAVKRNIERFPTEFMFQLSPTEKQEVVTNCDHLQNIKFSKSLPFAFTEHGAIQAANILNSSQAIEVGIYVVRAFIRLREFLASHQELSQRLDELEERVERKIESHDQAITGLIKTLRQMMVPPEIKKRPIGFVHPIEDK
jgi:hypothetical protein